MVEKSKRDRYTKSEGRTYRRAPLLYKYVSGCGNDFRRNARDISQKGDELSGNSGDKK